jgi:2-dehydro-3-deoxygluconokinase
MSELAGLAHMVFATEDELDLIGGQHDLERRWRPLADGGARQLIVRSASRGATVFQHGQSIDVSYSKRRVIDPVGAGDGFAAGYLSGVLDELSPAESAKRAHSVAAFVVSHRGDWEGLPYREELELINSQDVAR